MLSASLVHARTLQDVHLALSTHRLRNPDIPTDSTGHAAVAAIMRQKETLELLFIQRAEHKNDPWSGHMAFPGGRLDKADPSPLQAAIRETKEEIGLDLKHSAKVMGTLSPRPATARGRNVSLLVHSFVFAIQATDIPLTPDQREVQAALWVPFSFLADPLNRELFDVEYDGEIFNLPCCRYADRIIWGLTLHMVDELVQLVRKSNLKR